ncbi:MAG: replicative DNA helicase [Nitrospiraceae bacterium]|nr:MAG: replicative DNA helicase [Nitrospiraceae bacterium]
MKTAEIHAFPLPPQSAESEQALLGALLADEQAWDKVADVVTVADFYRTDHRLIYEAIDALVQAGKAADPLTVAERLQDQGKLEQVGGLEYLGSLAVHAPGSANARHYAQIVRERSVRRQLLAAANEVISLCHEPGGLGAEDIAGEAERAIFSALERRLSEAKTIGQCLSDLFSKVDERAQGGSAWSGLPTGFIDLDAYIGGLRPSDLIVIAGRPSMGKSALAFNIAAHAAKAGHAVAAFSLEMSAEQVTARLVSADSRVPLNALLQGRLSEDAWSRAAEAWGRLKDLPLVIDETPAVTCAHIRARCRRIKRAYGGLGLIVVDYLQLMRGQGENRTQEVGSISRGLKAIAKEFSAPVLVLSQLNRECERRTNKRPMMSDLRESGEVEQDADVILFVYRDEVYNPDSPDRGTAEVIVAKQRNGPTGAARLTYLSEYTLFANYAMQMIEARNVTGEKD